MHVSETSLLHLPATFRKAITVPISGLVITFESSVAEHPAALQSLGELPEIEIGDSGGSKLAVVVDSANKRRDQEIWNTLRELPGVIDLAVAMVAFDEDNEVANKETAEEEKNADTESIRNRR